jgi:hypothetical protein
MSRRTPILSLIAVCVALCVAIGLEHRARMRVEARLELVYDALANCAGHLPEETEHGR